MTPSRGGGLSPGVFSVGSCPGELSPGGGRVISWNPKLQSYKHRRP